MNAEEWRDLMAGLAMVGLLASGERGKHIGQDSYEYADNLISAKDSSTGIVSARKKRVQKQEVA